jgi:hypothetical protein
MLDLVLELDLEALSRLCYLYMRLPLSESYYTPSNDLRAWPLPLIDIPLVLTVPSITPNLKPY